MRILVLSIALCCSVNAFSKCSLKFSDLSSSYSMNTSPRRTIQFDVRSKKNQFVGVDAATGSYTRRKLLNPNVSEYLPFQLYNYSFPTVLKDLPVAGVTNLLYPYKSSGKNRSYIFRAVLSVPYKFAPAGRYSESYQFKVYEGTPSNYRPEPCEVRNVEFFYELERAIGVSLVRSGAPFDFYNADLDLDFGVLRTGKSKSFDIVVLSNAGFNVSAYSINDGVMQGTRPGSSVDYFLSIDNGPRRSLKGTIASPVHLSSYSGVTPVTGKRVKGTIVIGSLSNAGAGDYSDTIVIKAATVY